MTDLRNLSKELDRRRFMQALSASAFAAAGSAAPSLTSSDSRYVHPVVDGGWYGCARNF